MNLWIFFKKKFVKDRVSILIAALIPWIAFGRMSILTRLILKHEHGRSLCLLVSLTPFLSV